MIFLSVGEAISGIATPNQNPYGTWHAEKPRNDARFLIWKAKADGTIDDEPVILDRILNGNGESIFGILYSNDLMGRRGRTNGIYQQATYSTSGRTQKAFAAKNKAFVSIMGLDDNLLPLTQEERETLRNQALDLLRNFDYSAWSGPQSRPSSQVGEMAWLLSESKNRELYQLQHRAKELVAYLEAYEMLRPLGYQGIWEEQIARNLMQFASNIYFLADLFTGDAIIPVTFSRNNHRIIVGSALGMAAILLGEWGSTELDDDDEDRDARSYMPKYWIGYAMCNINSVLFQQDVPQVYPDGGYNEGPHYMRYGLAFALPFFRAMKNFGEVFEIPENDPDNYGDWIEEYRTRLSNNSAYDLRSPWFGRVGDVTPDIHDVLEWIAKIRQPEGRMPALADTYYDSYFPEAAIKGGHYFWPIQAFEPNLASENMINWSLADFFDNRVDFIVAGNLPQESPSEWNRMQIFEETGDITMRSGWGLEDIYFHIYAKDYTYDSDDDYLVNHLQHDNSSFIIGYNSQVLALDCGYISYDRRDEVEGSQFHNLILVNLSGPSKFDDKAQLLNTYSDDYYDFVKINADYSYSSTNIKRNILFCDRKYFILNDQINGSGSKSYMFVLHGNDSLALEFSDQNAAIWQMENAKLKSRVTSQIRGGGLSTSYVIARHDYGWNRTRAHKVLKVSKTANDTQFLSVHFPYDADLSPDPEIEDISTSAYAGFFVDRTSNMEYGNRYELMVSQWPVGNDLSIAKSQYGSNNRTIKAIETDAEFAVLSFDPNTPHDPNTMELFARGMTYFNYGDTILYPNHPPQLDQINNQSVQEGSVLDVPVSAQDPNGDIISFSVNNLPTFGTLIDNGDGTAIVRFTPGYFDAGDYPDIVVIAADDEIPPLTDQISFNLQVQNLNIAPVALALSNIQQGVPPLTVIFDGSSSYDLDHPHGFVARYDWDFDDGTGSDLAVTEHIYHIAGKYHVTLTVIDDDGAEDSDGLIITNDADISKIYISEVSDAGNSDFYAFLELYNDADYDIDLRECKLIQYDGQIMEGGTIEYYLEYIYDFGSDEQSPGTSTIIPAKGLLVISRGVTKSGFQGYWGVLPSNSNFNSGNSSLEFYRSRIWQLRYFDGTINTVDGSIIDDPQQFVSGEDIRFIQISRGVWGSRDATSATPGRLESDQSLPVELLSLSANADQNSIILKWKTGSELNNLGFIVQRSQNNDSLYKNIASYEVDQSLKGLGNSASGKEYTFIDNDVIQGIEYWYKILDVSFDGKYSAHGPVSAILLPYEDNLSEPPEHYSLYNNYPNPFNTSTMIQFDIPEQTESAVKTEINLYDILGRRVVQLYNGSLPAGRYRVNWNGKDQYGNMVPSGIYIYSMFSKYYTCSKKMILVR